MSILTPKYKNILGVKVSITTKSEVINFILAKLKKREKFFVSTPNPEIITAAQGDRELMEALKSSDIALPDGVGLRLAGIPNRLSGREMFEDLLKLANQEKFKIYLLGATEDVNSKAIAKIEKIYSAVKINGSGSLQMNNKGYSVTEKDIKISIDIIKDIDNFRPDILFVALGAPKQEKWIYHNLKKLNVGGAMAVGGSFDYFVGKMAKPPALLSSMGLEWLWRLVQEPTRYKRIFKAIALFPLLLVKDKIKNL